MKPAVTSQAPAGTPTRRDRRRLVAFARTGLLPLGDSVFLSLAVLAVGYSPTVLAYAATVLLILRGTGRHRLRICLRVTEELPQLAAAVALPLPILLAGQGESTRSVILTAVLLVTGRALTYLLVQALRRHGLLNEPALVVGSGTLGIEVAELMQTRPELGLRPLGFVDDLSPAGESTLPLLGRLTELPEILAHHGIRRVIVCFPAASDADLVTLFRATRPRTTDIYLVPRLYELGTAIPAAHRDELWGVPLLLLWRNGNSRIKRTMDLILGTVLLIALTPVLLVLTAAIRIRYGSPALFRQQRVMRSGQVSEIVKLRTLTDPDHDTRWTAPPGQRGALARWLRGTHLDELPQLLTVLSGQMSLVGPRPERPYFATQFEQVIPRYADRQRMPGGMTGWAQVHGLYGDTSMRDRVRFDNHYIEHWSPWLDLIILLRTPFRHRGARP
jgi:lipopolysaccharide/colanic/teichoic acid biosynthesis glycosyltransferase